MFQTPLDVVLLDLNNKEWAHLPKLVETTALHQTKQLIIVIHLKDLLDERKTNTQMYVQYQAVMETLTKKGFSKWKVTKCRISNTVSPFTGQIRSWCFYLFYVNKLYL